MSIFRRGSRNASVVGMCGDVFAPLSGHRASILCCSGIARNICDEPGLLTKIRSVGKVVQGRANGPFLLPVAPLLGGRTIGSTSDSGSDYPGSSPGLPATFLSGFCALEVKAGKNSECERKRSQQI